MADRQTLPAELSRASFRMAALAFWGLAIALIASDYIGPGEKVNYPIEWVITALSIGGGVVCWLLPWDRIPLNRFLVVIVAGIIQLTVSVMATGGVQSHQLAIYLVVVVFAASLYEFRVAGLVAVIAGLAAAIPLLSGWDDFYARSLLILITCMATCAFIPGLVRKALADENQVAEKRRLDLEASYLATIEALAAALDAKDRHTEAHSRETAALSLAVGRRLGLKGEALRFLEYGALLHDIGKIGVPGYVLNKPGPLDEEEMAMMREHPVIGERIVASVPFLAPVRPVVRAEHERWDGGGYPDGLQGEDIPIEARIIHACDAFQAMSSDRAYRRALPRGQILSELRSQSGRQFDPQVVAALLAVIEAGDVDIHGTADADVKKDKPVPEGQAWARHLDAIQELGAGLTSVTSVQDICHTIGQTIVTLLPYDQCRVYLLEDDGVTLRPAYFSDTKRVEYDGVTAETLAVKVGEGITGWVAETKRGVVINDSEAHPKALHVPGTGRNDESMIAVPVLFEDTLVGVIVTVKIGLHQYIGDHLRLLTILANQAAVSIANARLIERLETSATTDPLTGLANRRAFEQKLVERLQESLPEPFSVIMLDVDGLKQVNDARGHVAGDAVLKRVASVLLAHLRHEDLVTRWGGDEFVILMPGVDRVGAVSLARRIGGSLLTPADSEEPISVSIGTASYPADGTTTDELLAAADRSMYADKSLRRAGASSNRVA